MHVALEGKILYKCYALIDIVLLTNYKQEIISGQLLK